MYTHKQQTKQHEHACTATYTEIKYRYSKGISLKPSYQTI